MDKDYQGRFKVIINCFYTHEGSLRILIVKVSFSKFQNAPWTITIRFESCVDVNAMIH